MPKNRTFCLIGLLFGAVTLIAMVGCPADQGEGRAKNLTQAQPSVLLITMDTTRPDAIGAYGAKGNPTPNLDRLASAGVTFTECRSTSPLTLPAHASLLTSAWPPQHGIRDNGDFRLPEEATTLAEILLQEGYNTAAFVSSFVLDESFGLAQGFEVYEGPAQVDQGNLSLRRLERLDAEQIEAKVLAWMEEDDASTPHFGWVHFYDPHQPLNPPEPFKTKFKDAYQAEVARMDAAIGSIVDAWTEAFGEESIIMAISDHGEAQGAHGEQTHGLLTYGSTINIPWILKATGRVEAGRIDARPSSIVDVMPTLLALLNVEYSPLAGRSRVPLSQQEPTRKLYAESWMGTRAYDWHPLRSVREAEWVMVEGVYDELFNLQLDPAEQQDVAGKANEELLNLKRWLASEADTWQTLWGDATGTSDQETVERLQSLGYVGGGGSMTASDQALDPRTEVELHNQFLDVKQLVIQGKDAAAADRLNELLKRDPNNPTFLGVSGALAVKRGEFERGLKQLERAAMVSPGSFQAQLRYADALHQTGEFDHAEQVYELALTIQPQAGDAWLGLARLQLAAGNFKKALDSFDRAAEALLKHAELFAGKGVAYQNLGQRAEALKMFRQATELDPTLADAWNQQGVLLEQGNQAQAAKVAYLKAWEQTEPSAAAAFNLGRLALNENQLSEAKRWSEAAAPFRDAYPLLWLLKTQVSLAEGDTSTAKESLQQILRSPVANEAIKTRASQMLAAIP